MSRRPRGPEPWDAPSRPRPSARFERSARFWLNAYPRRWRDLHGDELIGVLYDVASGRSGSSERRLPRAEVVGLLRAGWSLRWREHPPFWRWLGYRLLDLRLPARYWWWVVDDIRSPLFPALRGTVGSVVFWATNLAFQVATIGVADTLRDARYLALFTVLLVAVIPFLGRRGTRRQAWLRHVVEGNVPAAIREAAVPGDRGLA